MSVISCASAMQAWCRGSVALTPSRVLRVPAVRCLSSSFSTSSSSSSTSSSSTPSSSSTRTPFSYRRISVSPLERIVLAAGSALVGFVDPARGDMVAMLGELTGDVALEKMKERMEADEVGRSILAEKPRVRFTEEDIQRLSSLPPSTFGSAYASFLLSHGFSPEERAQVRYVADPELAYIMQRHREVHDFWHVLAGLPPTVLGETAVKWLEMIQTGLPSTALSALVAPARLPSRERKELYSIYAPWAVRCGRQSKDLMCVRYENMMEMPLEQVRNELRFLPAPVRGRGVVRVAVGGEGSGAGGKAAAGDGATNW